MKRNIILTTLLIAVPLTFIIGFSFGAFTANRCLVDIHKTNCGSTCTLIGK